jgi:hypothetical protein
LSASESEDEEGMLDESEEELDEQQKQFMEFLAQKAAEEKDFEFDEEEIKNELDALLPAIPGKPNV